MTSLEPTLSKIPEKIHSLRPAASRRKRRLASQKNCPHIFDFARAIFYSTKEKVIFLLGFALCARRRAIARGPERFSAQLVYEVLACGEESDKI